MFYVNDEPEGKFLYIETIKLYCKDPKNHASVHSGQNAGRCTKACTILLHLALIHWNLVEAYRLQWCHVWWWDSRVASQLSVTEQCTAAVC